MVDEKIAYESKGVVWKETDLGLRAFTRDLSTGLDTPVTWAPQPGSQEAALTCPVPEILYEGTRGPGKTDWLLMKYAQHVGRGYGAEWNGVIFRKTFPELEDIIGKSLKWFYQIWKQGTEVTYNKQNSTWRRANSLSLDTLPKKKTIGVITDTHTPLSAGKS
jgi:hypothetical protein